MFVSSGSFTGFSVASALFESLGSVQDLGGSGFVWGGALYSDCLGISRDCDFSGGDFGVLICRYSWKKIFRVLPRGFLEEAVGGPPGMK